MKRRHMALALTTLILPGTLFSQTKPSVGNAPPMHAKFEAQRVQYAEPPEPIPPGSLRPGDRERIQKPLSIADLEAIALSNNPSIARGQALVNAARGNWVQVGLKPNPSVGYEGQQIGSGGRAEQDGVFVGQEFVRGGKLRLNREVAAQEVSRAEQQLAAQRQRVLTDVRIAFYAILIAERQERLTLDLLKIATQNLDTAETLLKGREVGRVDVVQAQLEYEFASILVQNARNRSAAAWQNLATVSGQPRLTPTALEGNPEEDRVGLSYQEAISRILATSPEIAVAVANMERARWAAQRARVEAVPNVTVQGLVNWRDEGIGGDPDGGITVGVPLPAWNRNQGGIQQAQAEVVAAERALEQVELDLQNRLAPVYERFANAKNQVERYRTRVLPAAQETLQLTRDLYRAGELGYIGLLTAQRTYSQTNLNYLDSLRELRTSEAEIEGLLLSRSLETR